jgi:hypothetical protein
MNRILVEPHTNTSCMYMRRVATGVRHFALVFFVHFIFRWKSKNEMNKIIRDSDLQNAEHWLLHSEWYMLSSQNGIKMNVKNIHQNQSCFPAGVSMSRAHCGLNIKSKRRMFLQSALNCAEVSALAGWRHMSRWQGILSWKYSNGNWHGFDRGRSSSKAWTNLRKKCSYIKNFLIVLIIIIIFNIFKVLILYGIVETIEQNCTSLRWKIPSRHFPNSLSAPRCTRTSSIGHSLRSRDRPLCVVAVVYLGLICEHPA